MEAITILIIALAFLINLVIAYVLISSAVKAAMEDIAKGLNLLTRLKIIETKKTGYGPEVQKVFDIIQKIEHLKKQRRIAT